MSAKIVEIYASVISPGKSPTGTVVFVCDGKTIGNAPLDAHGIACLKIPCDRLGTGSHKIVAHFAGNKHFSASVSGAFIKEVV